MTLFKKHSKKRLYIGLFPTGGGGTKNRHGQRRYHWAFLIGPKTEDGAEAPGSRHHAINTTTPDRSWVYDAENVADVRKPANMLTRVLIGKVVDEARLLEIFRNVPLVQNNRDWNCLQWAIDAFTAVKADGHVLGTAVLDWDRIEQTARKFTDAKVESGLYKDPKSVTQPRPTWDLLEDEEIVFS